MLSGRPSPTLAFDETVALLRELYIGEYMSVSLFRRRSGVPTMTVHGWCVRMEESQNSLTLVIRADRHDMSSPFDHIANELRIFRDGFQRAGEALDADELGPLAIEFHDLTAIVSLRDVVPDWEAIRRPR